VAVTKRRDGWHRPATATWRSTPRHGPVSQTCVQAVGDGLASRPFGTKSDTPPPAAAQARALPPPRSGARAPRTPRPRLPCVRVPTVL